MKRLAIFALLTTSLVLNSYAFWEEFYLKTRISPEKLLPETLTVTLCPDEAKSVYVDLLPEGASADISWEISPAIATLTQNGRKCTVKGVEEGEAKLTAITDNGISCAIKVKILENPPEIFLESADTINSGDTAIVYARPSVDDTVSWRVEGDENAKVSFGGNLCKIKPKKAGTVTVFATLENTTVSKTLKVLPAKSRELDLGSLGLSFAWIGVVILIVVFIHGRSYEKEF